MENTCFSCLTEQRIKSRGWNYDAIKTMHNNPGNGNASIYWVGTGIIDELRKTAKFSEKMQD